MDMDFLLNAMMGGVAALMILFAWWGLTAAGEEARKAEKARPDDDFEDVIGRGLKSGSVKRMKDL